MKLEEMLDILVRHGIRSLDDLDPEIIKRLLGRVMLESRIDLEVNVSDIACTLDVLSAASGRGIHWKGEVVRNIERTLHQRAMDELEEAFSDAVFEHESAA